MAVDVIMTRTLYPRSDSISAKVVAPSDFEEMIGQFINDHIVTGMTVTASSGLSVDVGVGNARLKGLVLDLDATENVGSLTDNTDNYVYAQLNRDGNSEAESWSFVINTTGTTPTDGLKIAKVTTSSGVVTAVSQVNQTDTFKYGILPTGSVEMYAGQYDNIPTGWLLCDGTAISRTTYKDLFDVVGTQFGVGDGSTTFNLPDLQAKFPRGATASADAGATGGEDTHILTTAELPSHSHTQGTHSHIVEYAYNVRSGSYPNSTNVNNALPAAVAQLYADFPGVNTQTWATTSTPPYRTTTDSAGSIGNTGSGDAHENRPAFVELLFIIRV